jgi:hypothetical protein
MLYLVDIEKSVPYLTEEDADVLADCDCLALFV